MDHPESHGEVILVQTHHQQLLLVHRMGNGENDVWWIQRPITAPNKKQVLPQHRPQIDVSVI